MAAALDRLRRYLDREHVPYVVREHPEAYRTQEIAALEHIAGRRMAKVVMVLAGDDLMMLVLPAPFRVSLEKVARTIPGQQIRLAHEEEFSTSFPDCDAGAMPPFGNLYGVPVYVDQGLAGGESIVFQAGTHRHTIEMAYADFARLVQPVVESFSDPPSDAG